MLGLIVFIVIICGIGYYFVIVKPSNEARKKWEEKEKIRLARNSKLNPQNRKCSNCRYGKRVDPDLIRYQCSSPYINGEVREIVDCQYFDSMLSSFINID